MQILPRVFALLKILPLAKFSGIFRQLLGSFGRLLELLYSVDPAAYLHIYDGIVLLLEDLFVLCTVRRRALNRCARKGGPMPEAGSCSVRCFISLGSHFSCTKEAGGAFSLGCGNNSSNSYRCYLPCCIAFVDGPAEPECPLHPGLAPRREGPRGGWERDR